MAPLRPKKMAPSSALRLQPEQRGGVIGVVEHERGGLIDRRRPRAGDQIRLRAQHPRQGSKIQDDVRSFYASCFGWFEKCAACRPHYLPTHRSLNKSFLCSAHEGGTSEVLAAICGRLDLRRVYKPSSVMIMSSSLVDSFRNAMSG